MSRLELVEDHIQEPVRIRVCRCSCGQCELGEMLAQRFRPGDDPRNQLWLSLGIDTMDALNADARFLLMNLDDDGVEPAAVFDVGCAFFGLSWTDLQSAETCALQRAVFEQLEAWHLRMPAEDVWAVRRRTFGGALTCVRRAVDAMNSSYAADSPVRAQWRRGGL